MITMDRIYYCIAMELQGSRDKHPDTRNMLLAITEECGELAKAVLQIMEKGASSDDVFKEAIHLIATTIRLIQEGDSNCPEYVPNLYESYRNFKPTKGKHESI